MQKLNYAEVLTLASFFESISASNQELPTDIWLLFLENYKELKDHALDFENTMYEKFLELFPDEVLPEGPERIEKDKEYSECKKNLYKQEVEVKFKTIDKATLEEKVPSMNGVRGIYLFLKYITDGEA